MLSLFIKENNPEKASDYSYHEGNQSAKSDYYHPCKYFQCQSYFSSPFILILRWASPGLNRSGPVPMLI